MDSLKCPITNVIFEDPVVGDDGHTYERRAITDWLNNNETSPITRQPMDIKSLKTNHVVKKIIDELKSTPQSQQSQYQFKLDVDIRKIRARPLFQGFGKSIYEVEWINRQGPHIILMKIDGAKANREASFYVQLSCHSHIVRTFGLVQCNPGSIMLLQECAPHGDLSELLRENGFKPTEQVLWEIFKQICDAMECLADNGITHGDLACRNVLVFQSNATEPKSNLVKVTDFGLTRGSTVYSVVESPALTTMTIIPIRYAAPEILQNLTNTNYSEKSDVYSMGVLMWEASSYGELPYSSSHADDDVRRQKLNNERLPKPSICSHQLWSIINQCWEYEPQDRPNFKALKESLSTLRIESTYNEEQKSLIQTTRVAERTNNDNPFNGNDRIPCEYCEKLIDVSDWSTHVPICTRQHEERIQIHARMLSEQPITEPIPCEYCQELCIVGQLLLHQMTCPQNPNRMGLKPLQSTYLTSRPTFNLPEVSGITNLPDKYGLSKAIVNQATTTNSSPRIFFQSNSPYRASISSPSKQFQIGQIPTTNSPDRIRFALNSPHASGAQSFQQPSNTPLILFPVPTINHQYQIPFGSNSPYSMNTQPSGQTSDNQSIFHQPPTTQLPSQIPFPSNPSLLATMKSPVPSSSDDTSSDDD